MPGSLMRQFIARWREEILAGLSGGLLLGLSFPPYPLRVLSLVALVPLLRYFLVIFPRYAGGEEARRRGFMAGFFYGIAFFGLLLFWIANLIPESAINLSWVLPPGVFLLVLYLALYPGLFGLAMAFLAGRYGKAALVAAPALWAATEFIRSNGEMAFSWGIVSLVRHPIAVQALFATGPFGFSMLVVTANLLVCLSIWSRTTRAKAAAASLFAASMALALWGGSVRMGRVDEALGSAADSTKVAIVQPNVDLGRKWKPWYRDTVFEQIERITHEAAAAGAELVVFPETAAPVSMSHQLEYRNWMRRIAREAGVYLYIGYIRHVKEDDRWRSFNSSGLFDPRGDLAARYDKVNLLQFGERIPFSQYLFFLEKIDFGQANFKRGKKQTIFESPAGEFGSLICFESTFADYTRKYVEKGADFLVNVTNDGWFGSARGPLQHSETAIMRAVENGVPVLRAANTGVSMYIDPAGRVIERIGLNQEGMILVSLPRTGIAPTPSTRWGRMIFAGGA